MTIFRPILEGAFIGSGFGTSMCIFGYYFTGEPSKNPMALVSILAFLGVICKSVTQPIFHSLYYNVKYDDSGWLWQSATNALLQAFQISLPFGAIVITALAGEDRTTITDDCILFSTCIPGALAGALLLECVIKPYINCMQDKFKKNIAQVDDHKEAEYQLLEHPIEQGDDTSWLHV
ncbi:hypothetical protein Cyrtocomes_00272 [Candidatus Cyrtobacter comes]|uniref:Cation/H+ exchanger domain-containing protein n=1 Tax=Candidatus Cyrtobacter comes TaxID=675776 RepID=A0ABU5L706_9RICK|nr:hypothetical protein [Candidatus Cyrtobacter comes]MDZ5761912.1 hypothetical protein [Candidatus Cyrtobacter comes]